MGIHNYGHCVQAVEDMDAATRFYAEVLGEVIGESFVHRSSIATTDQVLRQKRRLARNRGLSVPHGGVTLGKTLLPLFLYREHVQWPPPEQLVGTPRLAITVTPEQMDKAIEVFRRHKVPFEGPVNHPAPVPMTSSLYFKDPSSNFLELCCPRDQEV